MQEWKIVLPWIWSLYSDVGLCRVCTKESGGSRARMQPANATTANTGLRRFAPARLLGRAHLLSLPASLVSNHAAALRRSADSSQVVAHRINFESEDLHDAHSHDGGASVHSAPHIGAAAEAVPEPLHEHEHERDDQSSISAAIAAVEVAAEADDEDTDLGEDGVAAAASFSEPASYDADDADVDEPEPLSGLADDEERLGGDEDDDEDDEDDEDEDEEDEAGRRSSGGVVGVGAGGEWGDEQHLRAPDAKGERVSCCVPAGWVLGLRRASALGSNRNLRGSMFPLIHPARLGSSMKARWHT